MKLKAEDISMKNRSGKGNLLADVNYMSDASVADKRSASNSQSN